jgi:heme-degrading monooxygenase HmoA
LDYGFLVIWQFRVRPGMQSTFESIYGPQGEWARLFRTGDGYLRTEFIRSQSDPDAYLTLDFWKTEEAYDRFRLAHSAAYKEIDARCELLTDGEVELGRFVPVGN